MIVSGLTGDGDWRFGKGRAVYLRRSDAIQQNVVTRLRSFVNDWFLDVSNGLPWVDMLGTRDQEKRILREIEASVLSTEGVKRIDLLRLVSVDRDRGASIELVATDIFDETFTETVATP